MVYPENKAADEHFNNLRHQYADAMAKMRNHCDEATDSLAFIHQSIEAMENRASHCEDAVRSENPLKLVEHTSSLARLTNRVIQVAKQEADNSEEPGYSMQVNKAAETLQNGKKILFVYYSVLHGPIDPRTTLFEFQE